MFKISAFSLDFHDFANVDMLYGLMIGVKCDIGKKCIDKLRELRYVKRIVVVVVVVVVVLQCSIFK